MKLLESAGWKDYPNCEVNTENVLSAFLEASSRHLGSQNKKNRKLELTQNESYHLQCSHPNVTIPLDEGSTFCGFNITRVN